MKIVKIFTMFALALAICAGAYADINTGLVSAYTFEDGTAVDETGRNNGVVNGATKVAGKNGNCLKFDGTNDFVSIPDSPSLHLPEGLTVAAWINFPTGKDHSAICAKHVMIGWGANFSWRIATTSNTGMTWGRCKEGAENYFATDGVLPGPNQWIHVAMTCMAPGAATSQRAYVNGKDITDVTGQADNIKVAPPFLVFDGVPVEIGVGRGYGGTQGNDVYFEGMIDDVVIYNRGLTANEINDLMKTDLTTAVAPAGKATSTWAKIKSE
jgi:hypothetical protein